jgi:signal transduction histidine kinase
MIKLFITLYAVVLASFGLFFVVVMSIDAFDDQLSEMQQVNETLSKGTFRLLEQSIEELNQTQINIVVEQHQKVFGPSLKLFNLFELPLTQNEIIAIKRGEIVNSEEENDAIRRKTIESTGNEPVELDFLYKKVPNTSWVWRLNLDINVRTSIHNLDLTVDVQSGSYIDGMYYLIHKVLLLKQPKEKWAQLLLELQSDYGILLSLHNEIELLATLQDHDNGKGLQALISAGKLANITRSNDQAVFIKRLPNSGNVLQIGPVQVPWIIQHFIHLAIMSFMLSIATMLFLWVRPFWLSLLNIKQAADQFGAGNYSARIPYKKRSPIAKIANAFNKMAEQTQRSIHSHKELTSAVSHELRTPVARMRFALEMLAETNNKKDKQRFVSNINTDIDDLDLLLEELLTYARFDRQDSTIKLITVNLVSWINNSMEKLMPLANEKKLRYQVKGIADTETAQIEPRLMSRVLDNLVQNGLRYADREVKVTLNKHHSDYLLVVEDDGKGIPEKKRAHVFDAFSRIDSSRDRASGGFGLGLAIAERIVTGHQGKISIDDSVLGGARFKVRFS